VFRRPDTVAINPADPTKLRTSKASTSGVYLLNGLAEAPSGTVWGVPLVSSPSVPAGIAYVSAFHEGATLFVRESQRIAIAETGAGDGAGTELFTTNSIRVLVEARLLLALYNGDAFCAADLAA
jgi:HK97 family phage major capsid protein